MKSLIVVLFLSFSFHSYGNSLPTTTEHGLTPDGEACQWTIRKNGTHYKLNVNVEKKHFTFESRFQTKDILVKYNRVNHHPPKKTLSMTDLGYNTNKPKAVTESDSVFYNLITRAQPQRASLLKVEARSVCPVDQQSLTASFCEDIFQKHINSFSFVDNELLSVHVDVVEDGELFIAPLRWFYDVRVFLGLGIIHSLTCNKQ